MANPTDPSPRERALALARSKGVDLSDTMLAALDDLVAPIVAPSERPQATSAPLPVTPLSLDVALRSTFSIDEIGNPVSNELEQLLANTETVIQQGRRRLQLTPRARAWVLSQSQGSPTYRKTLEAAIAQDQEDFHVISTDSARCATAWLRCFLGGEWGDLERAPVHELRAAREALSQLALVKLSTTVPTLEHVTSLLERAQWLEPMIVLVGSRGGWDGTPASDRFAGRETELRTLRAFVDALESETYTEAVQRGLGRISSFLSQAWSSEGVPRMTLEAPGGLGKSTLLAKFILDHARNPRHPIPTVFLDFDRATLHCTDARRLLLETVRQLRLQFPSLAQPLKSVELGVRMAMVKKESATADASGWGEWLAALRHGLKAASHQPLLLVLDTLEVVRSVPQVLEAVAQFLEAMTSSAWRNAVRVVLSGRADVPELSRPRNAPAPHRMTLKALSFSDAKLMVKKLGESFLEREWRTAWNARLCGRAAADDRRREPLTLRIAVELIRAEPTNQGREALSIEIEQMTEDVAGGFVGPLYQRRILSHIRDPEVRKLAWPGLVLRRITPAIADELLADVCSLDRERLKDTLAALRRETWIVTPDEEGGLRHEPELRQRTLPLMRRQPEFSPGVTFDRVNRAAIHYFAQRKADPSARAEWIYHRLLANEPPEAIERDLTPPAAIYLAEAADDFPEQSEARNYLYARAHRTALTAAKIRRLPAQYAFEHVARTMPDLGLLGDERLSPIVSGLDFHACASWSSRHTYSERLWPVVYSLAVKTGRWNWDFEEPRSGSYWADPALCAHLFVVARSRFGSIGRQTLPAESLHDARGRHFAVLLMALVDQVAAGSLHGHSNVFEIENIIEQAMSGRRDRSDEVRTSALLTASRLLSLCGRHAQWTGWIAYHRTRAYRATRQGLSSIEVRTLLDLGQSTDDAHDALRRVVETDKRIWRLLQRHEPGVIREPSVVRAAIHSWKVLASREMWQHVKHGARRFAALRHEDWIVPLAYAASRAFPKGIPVEAQAEVGRVSGIGIESGWRGDQAFLDFFAMSDDAGIFPKVVAELSRLAPPDSDFSQRATDLETYTGRVRRLIG